MHKLIAIVNVISWSGFWAFGYLALSADVRDTGQIIVAAILAALGAGLGIWAYLRLARYAERTGYDRKVRRADLSHMDPDKDGGTA